MEDESVLRYLEQQLERVRKEYAELESRNQLTNSDYERLRQLQTIIEGLSRPEVQAEALPEADDIPVTILWQLGSPQAPLIRCELKTMSGGTYRLCVRKSDESEPCLVHHYADRGSAISRAIGMYRELKDAREHEHPSTA